MPGSLARCDSLGALARSQSLTRSLSLAPSRLLARSVIVLGHFHALDRYMYSVPPICLTPAPRPIASCGSLSFVAPSNTLARSARLPNSPLMSRLPALLSRISWLIPISCFVEELGSLQPVVQSAIMARFISLFIRLLWLAQHPCVVSSNVARSSSSPALPLRLTQPFCAVIVFGSFTFDAQSLYWTRSVTLRLLRAWLIPIFCPVLNVGSLPTSVQSLLVARSQEVFGFPPLARSGQMHPLDSCLDLSPCPVVAMVSHECHVQSLRLARTQVMRDRCQWLALCSGMVLVSASIPFFAPSV